MYTCRSFHFKGFGKNYRNIIRDFCKFLGCAPDNIPDAFREVFPGLKFIYWDGDMVRDDSFTAVLKKLAKIPDIHLVSFVDSNDFKQRMEHFEKVFENRTIGNEPHFVRMNHSFNMVTVIPIDVGGDWTVLGRKALEQTKCQNVYCFGGGGTVKTEAENSSEVEWRVYRTERKNDDGAVEFGSLNDSKLPNIKFLN